MNQQAVDAEIAFGAAKSTKRKESHDSLNEFILPLEVAEFDQTAALHRSRSKSGTLS